MTHQFSNKLWTWIAIITASLTLLSSLGFISDQPILTTFFEYSILLFLIAGFLYMLLNGTILQKPKFLIPIVFIGLLPFVTIMFELSTYLTSFLWMGLNVCSQVTVVLIYFFHYRQKRDKSGLDNLKLIWLISTQTLNLIGYYFVIMHWPGEELIYWVEITLSVFLVLYFYGHGIVIQSWLKKNKAVHND